MGAFLQGTEVSVSIVHVQTVEHRDYEDVDESSFDVVSNFVETVPSLQVSSSDVHLSFLESKSLYLTVGAACCAVVLLLIVTRLRRKSGELTVTSSDSVFVVDLGDAPSHSFKSSRVSLTLRGSDLTLAGMKELLDDKEILSYSPNK